MLKPMKPILIDFPDQIETDRLILRCPTPADAPAMLDAIQASMAELRPWMPWANDDMDLAKLTEFIRRAQASYTLRRDFRLSAFLKDDGKLIGNVSMHHIDWVIPKLEIGYWLDTRYTGCGYTVEAVKVLTEFAHDKLGMFRVAIHCDSLNVKSRVVAERAGFVFEARLYNAYRSPLGELRDELIFARIWPDNVKHIGY
jgi:ribosomal-protein-serine acetyltransferase